ncbi:hypothetical protein VZT92_005878 [Zoarces viviparus]|uniref:Peptidase A2 domain-containing protein n=1 Tax=Zoarces viviparus TaxID=48416 RepID=A0AAW1FQR5_ZOAVI
MVLLRNGEHTLETDAILDDGSEWTILLPAAMQRLKLSGEPEDLVVRTVRQVLHGAAVSFSISPEHSLLINWVWPSTHTDKCAFEEVQTPKRPSSLSTKHNATSVDWVSLSPPHHSSGAGASGTSRGASGSEDKIGTLQGPTKHIKQQSTPHQCPHISTLLLASELLQSVERLWQLDVLPYRTENISIRSRQDQEAVQLLESKTTRADVNGIQRYATPLLRVKNMPQLQACKGTVLANLHSTSVTRPA